MMETLHNPLRSKVSNYLNEQRKTGQFCDVTIEIENGATNKTFPAHFCILAAQSSLISSSQLQTQQFSIRNPLKITIHNFQCTVCVQTIVDFFYEDIVAVAMEHQAHFRILVKLLSITELLTLYNISQNADEETDETNLTAITISETTEAANDVFTEERNYFKLKSSRPLNGSNKINYCMDCDFTTYRVVDMIDHMRSCEASHLTCSLCEIGFLSWREYDTHLRKHSVDMKKPFFCLECNSRFMTRASLMVHQPKHTSEKNNRCVECGKGFKWKHGLANHLLIHSQEKKMLCDVCGYSTTHMKALKSHKLKHTGELFRCPHSGCKHQANRKENLKLHIETHKEERSTFVCEICGCKFSQSKNLKRHALKHSAKDINRYQCQLCSFASHRSDKLKEHVSRVHTEKAIQLELPEVVENSFENRLEDEFDLPIINIQQTLVGDEGKGSMPSEKRQRRTKSIKSTNPSSSRNQRPILPKPS